MTLKLQQLKVYLSGDDFLSIVIDESDLAADVFKLFDEISQQDIPNTLSRYLIEFEALFRQLINDLSVSKQTNVQLEANANEMQTEWELSKSCEEKLNSFEAKT